MCCGKIPALYWLPHSIFPQSPRIGTIIISPLQLRNEPNNLYQITPGPNGRGSNHTLLSLTLEWARGHCPILPLYHRSSNDPLWESDNKQDHSETQIRQERLLHWWETWSRQKTCREKKLGIELPQTLPSVFTAESAAGVGHGSGTQSREAVLRREKSLQGSRSRSRDHRGVSAGTLASFRTGVMRRPGPQRNCWCTSQVLLSP